MWHSYIFGGRKDRLNVIVLHSKQEHTLARGTSLAESYLLNFSEVKQIVLGSQISSNRWAVAARGVKGLSGVQNSPQGQTRGNNVLFFG